MGAATGLLGIFGAFATEHGASNCGVGRTSTGLAGGPVPTVFGRASGASGLCGERVMKNPPRTYLGAYSQAPHLCPKWTIGLLASDMNRKPRVTQYSCLPWAARLTSGGWGLEAALRGCCWSAKACRVISRAWEEVAR